VRLLSLTFVAALLLTSGCAGFQPAVEVPVVIAAPCVSRAQLPAKPRIRSDAELARMDDWHHVNALYAEREAAIVYQARLEALIEGCITQDGK
jgi:hypothetical protein